MAIRRFSTAEPGVKSNKLWDQDTAQGAIELIAVNQLVTAADSIYFFNIPQTYQDLYIVWTGRTQRPLTLNEVFIRLNSTVTGTSFSSTTLKGTGSSVSSYRETSQTFGMNVATFPAASANSGIFGSAIVHILDYKNSSKYKTVLTRSSADINGSGEVRFNAATWTNTTAINAINFYGGGGGTDYFHVPGSTVTIYGIKAGA